MNNGRSAFVIFSTRDKLLLLRLRENKLCDNRGSEPRCQIGAFSERPQVIWRLQETNLLHWWNSFAHQVRDWQIRADFVLQTLGEPIESRRATGEKNALRHSLPTLWLASGDGATCVILNAKFFNAEQDGVEKRLGSIEPCLGQIKSLENVRDLIFFPDKRSKPVRFPAAQETEGMSPYRDLDGKSHRRPL